MVVEYISVPCNECVHLGMGLKETEQEPLLEVWVRCLGVPRDFEAKKGRESRMHSIAQVAAYMSMYVEGLASEQPC